MQAKIEGVVKHYKGNGRKLGYPTANIDVKTDLKDGVYFGFADLGDYRHSPALIFIGTPTTVGDTDRRVEAHLLDIVDKDYYNLPMTLEIHEFHRANQNFDSIEELMKYMHDDEKQAREWFKSH